jgi:glycosyltransferase involved in cell wall biosynthesis
MAEKDIAVIIPSLNEGDAVVDTVCNLLASASNGEAVEVVVVDDSSDKPVGKIDGATVVRNPFRCGPASSRDIGICHTTAPVVLTADAHMEFPIGWMDRLTEEIRSNPESIVCTACQDMDTGATMYGATIDIIKEASDIRAFKILEPRWNLGFPGRQSRQVMCVMGGAYAFNRDWNRKILGFRGIKGWCPSELVSLSLKSWLAGGDCRVMPSFVVRHRFRKTAPFSVNQSERTYNKMRIAQGLLPPSPYAGLAFACLGGDKSALEMFSGDLREILREREHNQSVAKRSLEEVCERFGVELPQIRKTERNGLESTTNQS